MNTGAPIGAGATNLLIPFVSRKECMMPSAYGETRTRYNIIKSGWFDQLCFEDWFRTFALSLSPLEGPIILIGENLSSRLSMS